MQKKKVLQEAGKLWTKFKEDLVHNQDNLFLLRFTMASCLSTPPEDKANLMNSFFIDCFNRHAVCCTHVSSTRASQWKCSNITPIPKNSLISDASHYCPISLPSKLMERHIYNLLVDELNQVNFFSTCHFSVAVRLLSMHAHQTIMWKYEF